MRTGLKERDISLDILRCLGLILIILAHVSPPELIFEARSFDVPLMVFVSGMAFLISGKKDTNFLDYVYARIRRLLFPMWAFLTIFFTLIFFIKIPAFEHIINRNIMLGSYLMMGGIGYVWVIKIFLVIALLSPIFVKLTKNISNNKISLISVSIALVSYLMNIVYTHFLGNKLDIVVKDLLIPAISYGAFFCLGYRYKSFNENERKKLFYIALGTLLAVELSAYFTDNKFFFPNEFKYPPSLVYVLYPIIVIPFLVYFSTSISSHLPKVISRIVVYISSNTIWIYFLHIPVIELMKWYNMPGDFVTRWLIALSVPLAIYFMQRKVIIFISGKITNIKLSKLIKQTFTG